MILLIDNYDSFTYNLVQAVEALGREVKVIYNDALSVAEIADLKPQGLIISPGPCSPNEAGVSVAAIRFFADKLPILGVCLGHQSLAAAFGGDVVRAAKPMHGKVSEIMHEQKGLFANLSSPLPATRYHSLVVKEETLPSELEVHARSNDGVIMALQLKSRPVFGLQFHPESIMTPSGPSLIKCFLAYCS